MQVYVFLSDDAGTRPQFSSSIKNVLKLGQMIVRHCLNRVAHFACIDCKNVAFKSTKFVIIPSLHR
jgi:hypothetical protein